MTAAEAAKQLGVSKSLVERWIRRGLIKVERAGKDGLSGQYLINRDVVEEFAKRPRPKGRPRLSGPTP